MFGYEILARCLEQRGIDAIFYITGGPMMDCQRVCEDLGIRMIDVRHEQAAAMMCTGYARLTRRPSVCMGASGPGTTNLVTGIANAYADGSPVIALGGASPDRDAGMGAFQDTDQVALFRPITRWSERCVEARRIPEFLNTAFVHACGLQPGPVYLDLPGDVLYQDVPDAEIRWVTPSDRPLPMGDPTTIERALDLIANAERPVILSGSGVIWSNADAELRAFVEAAGIPFFTTPQGRGVIREDHELSFLGARSAACSETDLIVQVATRQNYVNFYLRPPRWNSDAKLIQIDIDVREIGLNRQPDVGIVGDAKAVLTQLVDADGGRLQPDRYDGWISRLRSLNVDKMSAQEKRISTDDEPIHPLRLCKEVRDVLPPEAILVVDGQEILTYARQSIPFYKPHSLNSGPYGCMGVGLPLGIGAKLAAPDLPVLVLHGDGSFGMNAMEMDTALRHNISVVCVISNNGGWTGRNRQFPGRDLGFTRYDLMFGAIGCHSEFVEHPSEIRPALLRALEAGKPAVVNVITDGYATATSTQYSDYMT